MVRVLRSPVDNLACALFPSSCALCGDSLLRLNGAPICDLCWNSLSPQDETLCACCGEALGLAHFSTPLTAGDRFGPGDLLCQPCRLAPPAFVKAVAFGAYQGHLRSLIHLLKYDGMQPLAHRLGELLAQSLDPFADASGEARRMLVVPVPMHRAKQRRRGFNHAALLAQTAISKLGRSHPEWDLRLALDVLERVKPTLSQAGLTAGQRRRNLRGAFVARRPAQLAGRDVLLVDDVYTTGATARACSRVLIAGGAASVRVATVARAQREGVALWDAHFMRHAGFSAGKQQPAGDTSPGG